MSPNEREYFVSRIRVGYWLVEHNNHTLKIVAPTTEDVFLSEESYRSCYDEYFTNGIIRKQELNEWKNHHGIWTPEDEDKIKAVEKDIENNKVKCYEYRNQLSLLEAGKKLLGKMSEMLQELKKRKATYDEYTCEGMAEKARNDYIFKKTSKNLDGSPYDFESNGDADIWMWLWSKKILRASQVRELARTDPWLGYWNLKKQQSLFPNNLNGELNLDQKQMLIWSNMYQSIAEGMEQPEDLVMEDEILLDGWLIVQSRKREEEKKKREADKFLEDKNLGSANEVFFVAKTQEDHKHIEALNSPTSQRIKRERMQTIKNTDGSVSDLDFKDKKIEMQAQQNKMFKNKFRKGR